MYLRCARRPLKKWSFTSALSRKCSSSPSQVSQLRDPFSSRSTASNRQTVLDLSSVKTPNSRIASNHELTSVQHEAMASAISLRSLSSFGSHSKSLPPPSPGQSSIPLSETPEHSAINRTASSVNTNQTTTLPQAVVTNSSHVSEGPSRRLTPSAIPFFRRSSQSIPRGSNKTNDLAPISPTSLSSPQPAALQIKHGTSVNDTNQPSPTTPQKKTLMLSLGLPSLLKSSASRRSLQTEKSDTLSRDTEKSADVNEKEKAKLKKEDKERSES
jgi:dual specificity tyrosine-phosphorylation-regulated kinase 2/3/4